MIGFVKSARCTIGYSSPIPGRNKRTRAIRIGIDLLMEIDSGIATGAGAVWKWKPNGPGKLAVALRERCLAEHALEEVVQIVSPLRRIVGMAIHIPHVRHVLFLEISVHPLANADEPILIPNREP